MVGYFEWQVSTSDNLLFVASIYALLSLSYIKIHTSSIASTVQCHPSRFEISHLVKIEMSFVLFSRKRNQSKMPHMLQPVLRSITLLDSMVRKEAIAHVLKLLYISLIFAVLDVMDLAVFSCCTC